MLKTIPIDELEVGMFVQDIKLKNSRHKVKNQGKVNSPRTIELLKKQGAVSIVVKLEPENLSHAANDNSKSHTQLQSSESYTNALAQSQQLYDQATENVKKLFSQAATGQKLTTDNIKVLAGEITESVMRNEYAITLLTRIRQQSNYQWEHSINTAVLVCGFGLYLGMGKNTLTKIALGALFHDIGCARVSRAILDKNSALSKNETSIIKKHIHWGIEMGKRDKFLDNVIIDMMVNHHERLDGSGYPRGVDKAQLSKLARIIAIVDVYDAMTADKPYKKGLQPMAAMRYLLSNKDKFDAELVHQFIKFLGVYPVGSLVSLSNDRLAIITEGNRNNPLKPNIAMVYSTKLNAMIKPKFCNLASTAIEIVTEVKSEDFQINLPKLIRSFAI
ncbi:HD-GYP domain-containing protein [Thalassotalea atypica]|uniref:HD-GYP domain-containing protein n=1 Tax=Thalassotalea atypica TaxID=2054316 RepID=UPI002572733E|nr:HD-GYP domain-containing protein [Thalassotalea atypica]